MHEIRNAGKVLELGCGNGVNFRNMKILGATAEFHGIDIMAPSEIYLLIVYDRGDGNLRGWCIYGTARKG